MDNNRQTIFIGNLPFSTNQNELQDAFEKFGTISEINIPTNRETGKPRGFAFVKFESEDSAQEALSMDGQDFNGRNIKVSIALGKKENPRPRTGGSRFGGNNDRRSSGGFHSRSRF